MQIIKRPSWALIGAMAVIFGTFAVVVNTGILEKNKANKHSNDTYPLEIKISPRQDTYKKSEYVLLDVSAKNVSDFDISTPWGTCAGLSANRA